MCDERLKERRPCDGASTETGNLTNGVKTTGKTLVTETYKNTFSTVTTGYL
jgi:hypothetical protein